MENRFQALADSYQKEVSEQLDISGWIEMVTRRSYLSGFLACIAAIAQIHFESQSPEEALLKMNNLKKELDANIQLLGGHLAEHIKKEDLN